MTSKPPKITMKERLAATAAKRDDSISTNREIVEAISSDVDKGISAPKATPKTLPKVTLYAHAKVLKAIRLLAAQDEVQAQEILRAAVREYLATRGHHFQDLTTGE